MQTFRRSRFDLIPGQNLVGMLAIIIQTLLERLDKNRVRFLDAIIHRFAQQFRGQYKLLLCRKSAQSGNRSAIILED